MGRLEDAYGRNEDLLMGRKNTVGERRDDTPPKRVTKLDPWEERWGNGMFSANDPVACGARPASSAQPLDGTDRGSKPRLPDTRHCDAVSSGTGKSHIALALGLAACQRGMAVGFATAAGLVHQLMEARDEKRLLRLQSQLAAYKLLIIDELGYVPLSPTGAELLFEVFSQRYERGSIIVTSNLPFEDWTSIFGSERLTGALLDRLTHHVHILEMNGDSYRLKQSKNKRRCTSRSANEDASSAEAVDSSTGEIVSR